MITNGLDIEKINDLLVIARKIAYPRRGTEEMVYSIMDAAAEIQDIYTLEELESKFPTD